MTKKIHKLKLIPDSEFFLIGISSHENDYRVCWAINSETGISLVKSEDLEIKNIKNSIIQKFSMFDYFDEEKLIKYKLISNRCFNGFLVEDQKNIDFFIKFSGDVSENEVKVFNTQIKNINIINTSFIVNLQSFNSKNKFIF